MHIDILVHALRLWTLTLPCFRQLNLQGRRVGRGIGSSKGKTCGRGHKGQKARAGGGVSPLFEGGQTKFYKRIPKRGFKNNHAEAMVPLNVGTLQDYIDMGRLTPPSGDEDPLTMKDSQ